MAELLWDKVAGGLAKGKDFVRRSFDGYAPYSNRQELHLGTLQRKYPQ